MAASHLRRLPSSRLQGRRINGHRSRDIEAETSRSEKRKIGVRMSLSGSDGGSEGDTKHGPARSRLAVIELRGSWFASASVHFTRSLTRKEIEVGYWPGYCDLDQLRSRKSAVGAFHILTTRLSWHPRHLAPCSRRRRRHFVSIMNYCTRQRYWTRGLSTQTTRSRRISTKSITKGGRTREL